MRLMSLPCSGMWCAKTLRMMLLMAIQRAFQITIPLTLCICLSNAATAQTLDLGGVPTGPSITQTNGATDLATLLEAELRALNDQAANLTGEAKSGASARARVRGIAAYLLRAGAMRPWNESAPAVDGARLALLIGRIDALVELAVGGRAMPPRTLSADNAKRAIRLLEAIASASIEPMRKAMVSPTQALPAQTARALGTVLAPLAELAELLEGRQNDDPWPVLIDARAASPERMAPCRSSAEIRASLDALPNCAEKSTMKAALDATIARGSSAAQDLRLLDRAADTVGWLVNMRASGAPFPISEAALAASLQRIVAAVVALSPTADERGAIDARSALEALEKTDPAARAMLSMRSTREMTEQSRAALSDAASSILSSESGGASGELERARAATRIIDACAAADRLENSLLASAPRDLKDVLRQLDRDARFAVRALAPAFKAIAADPAASSEPGNLSALDRVKSIDADRRRIVMLQGVIDSIGAISPGAGRNFATIGKRMAKLLLEPLKRAQGQAAFAALEAQFSAAFPFAYEDELKRRSPRAIELTGGAPERVIERAASLRAAWCEAVATGDLGGSASRRMDNAARLCKALRDLDQLVEPINRSDGDKLATWGGWATRRAMIAPATQDLTALASLAARSFVASATTEGQATFERDLLALESAIPLVRLTAAIERKLAPLLRGDPETVAAQLAPLLVAPTANAYLADAWIRLLTMHRAMIEAEFARRTGDAKLRQSLDQYLALVALEIEQSAFGGSRVVGPVPGFDGSQPRTDDSKPKGTRGRDR